ncbi:MAG: oxidoreductase [Blastopirellula sp.]|nr:MAG: oxidoreductase [Blastopirellula sp.]
MIDLSGHAALVTGSSQGVGQAIAESLAAAGANVVVHGAVNDDALNTVLENCRSKDVQAEAIDGDLAGETESCVESVFSKAIAAMPGIDILINNAGTFREPAFLEMTPAIFERTLRLNVAAGFFLTQAFSKKWIDEKTEGRVLFTGSINGMLAEPDHSAYDTSKGAVAMMVKTLCVALAPKKIRVNGIAPGLVRTPLTNVLDSDPALLEWMKIHTPNGQVPDAEVCGDTAAFLVSDAAKHIHGQMIFIDGGMSVWQQPDLPQ